MAPEEVQAAILAALTNDLRRRPWKGASNLLSGHCYVASEAAYHLLGGREEGWTPAFLQHEGAPHWFLRHADGRILDLTAGQFTSVPRYAEARGKGFLTKAPSRRAQIVIDRIPRSAT